MRQFGEKSSSRNVMAREGSSQSLSTTTKAVSRDNRPLETNARIDGSGVEVLGADMLVFSDLMQNGQTSSTSKPEGFGSLTDFTWPDLNTDEFDFEASLCGRGVAEATDTGLDSLSFTPGFPHSQRL
jgi:hypothetical protein